MDADEPWRRAADTAMDVLERIPSERVRARIRRRRLFNELLQRDFWGFPAREDTVPPAGERVTVHAVLAAEYFTPVHAPELIERLDALGFKRSLTKEGLAEELRRYRAGSGQAWLNLDIVVPRGRAARSDRVVADLPRGVSAGFLSIHALTPSLTTLLVTFILDDQAAASLDAVARRFDFRPRATLSRHEFKVDHPAHVKAEAVDQTRRRLRALPADWLASHIPGAFAADPSSMPTTLVVTTDVLVPFDPSTDDPSADVPEWLTFSDSPTGTPRSGYPTTSRNGESHTTKRAP